MEINGLLSEALGMELRFHNTQLPSTAKTEEKMHKELQRPDKGTMVFAAECGLEYARAEAVGG